MDAVDQAISKFPIKDFAFERDERSAMKACTFAIIGSSKSGKTTFLKYLVKKYFPDEIKILHTQSPQNEIYDSIRKDGVFCPAFIPDIIKETYKINKDTKNHYDFLHIVDDVVGAKQNIQMTRALCLYRNSGISTIVSGQDMMMLNATGRANVNYVCLFYANTDNRCEDNIKHFLRSYFPRNLSMDEKIELYKRLTQDHAFLFIDNLNSTITRFKLKPGQIMP
jgi:ABC-type multidrug transport system ATPase subunit